MGIFYSITAHTLSGSMETPSCDITKPKMMVFVVLNTHFSGLINKLTLDNFLKTLLTYFLWSVRLSEYMRMSSTQQTQKMFRYSMSIIDKPLTGCWSICKTERNYQEFVQTVLCLKGGFPLVTFFDIYQIIRGSQIEAGEHQQKCFFH